MDAATTRDLRRGPKGRRLASSVRAEYDRVTRAWLPLLAAALHQPGPTMALQGEAERIRLSLEDEHLAALEEMGRVRR